MSEIRIPLMRVTDWREIYSTEVHLIDSFRAATRVSKLVLK